MSRRRNVPQVALAGATLVAATVVACGPTPMASEDHDPVGSALASEVRGQSDPSAQLSASVNRDLAAVRRATARLQDTANARAAGYEVLVTHPETGAECLSHGTHGGMGYHFLNPALVNDEVVVDQPEVILYEKGPNGEFRLVAVEYIIPFSIRGPDEPPPVLFGREFVHNNTFNLWMLHAWVWKNNPSGMFADWNPSVSCD
jgi:hypothetical protein